MNFTIVLSMLLYCNLILAQADVNVPEAEKTSETQSCFPDMCDFLKEFCAMKEKQRVMETRLKDSENQNLIHFKTSVENSFGAALGEGIFAAPVPGIYYFTFFYHAGGSRAVFLYLMKNNQAVVTTSDHATSHDLADNGGSAVFLQLQQGDQVGFLVSQV
uniref:C1q domain-containing protein n=1 Tax=Dicentrarchus labrax TaxID=13489 RepID=A0A8C4GX98_DICLA